MKYFTHVLLTLFFLLINTLTFADIWEDLQEHEFQENDVEEYVWKEGDSQMPDYPKNLDLVEVSGPAAYQNYQYLIDTKNLQLGTDGVVRYSLVIRSSSGADNVLYEGIRCNHKQIKTYAYGITDMNGRKKFVGRNAPNWKQVTSSGANGYGSIFIKNYFCSFNGKSLKRNEIIQNIKYGKGTVDGTYY
ncbi:MAG: CNP1-like family protein [gamma proteobacterium symbiont of Taylorina sp.]|nr:CNP1-like family protein [gamma proteobacterium symbiont of Taylorina sp.]